MRKPHPTLNKLRQVLAGLKGRVLLGGGSHMPGSGSLWGLGLRWLLVAGLLGLLFLAGWFIKNLYQQHREAALLRQAIHFGEVQDWSASAGLVRQILRQDPTHVRAILLMAELGEHLQDIDSFDWYRRLVSLDPRPEHLFVLGNLALEAGDPDTVEEVFALYPAASRESDEWHLLKGAYAVWQGFPAQASEHFQVLYRRDPENDLYRFNLASVLLLAPSPEAVEWAGNTLHELRDHPEFAHRIKGNLLEQAIREEEWTTARQLAQDLFNLPDPRIYHIITYLELTQRHSREEFETSLERAKTLASGDGRKVYQLTLWLNRQERRDEAIAWLEGMTGEVIENHDYGLALSGLYRETENWARKREFLTAVDWGDFNYLRFALLAQASREMADFGEFRRHWQRAVGLTAGQRDRIIAVAELAYSWGWEEEAVAIYWSTLEQSRQNRWVYLYLHRIFAAGEDTEGLLRLYQRLLSTRPQDPHLQHLVAYHSLLLNLRVDEAHNLAGRAFELQPEDPYVVRTKAFSLYQRGRFAEAMEMMERMPGEYRRRPYFEKMELLIAKALAPDQQEDLSERLEGFPEEEFLPEERRLWETLRHP